jgi:glycerol uptake facilitator-like aquaporin
MYVRIAGQMGGGLIAFPMFHALSNYLKLEPFGGPEYNMDTDHHSNAVAFLSEFEATFLLVLVVFAVNLQLNFGPHHYLIKQSLTAIAIRALIEVRLRRQTTTCFGESQIRFFHDISP